jgi:hypothetical protein
VPVSSVNLRMRVRCDRPACRASSRSVTWSLIGVSGLASPGLLVEIRATAAYPDAS